MKTRPLGNTGIDLPILSFGASSLGAEFRSITLDEAMLSTKTAIDLGMNFIDTSPYYGRGMSEIMLGLGLKGIPREKYLLGTKLGRYSNTHFDFSARRVEAVLELLESGATIPFISRYRKDQTGNLDEVVIENIAKLTKQFDEIAAQLLQVHGDDFAGIGCAERDLGPLR